MIAGDGRGREFRGVVSGGDVVEGAVVGAAGGDAVEGRADLGAALSARWPR